MKGSTPKPQVKVKTPAWIFISSANPCPHQPSWGSGSGLKDLKKNYLFKVYRINFEKSVKVNLKKKIKKKLPVLLI